MQTGRSIVLAWIARFALVAAGLLAVGGLSFLATRATRVLPGAEAQPISTPKAAPSPIPTVPPPGFKQPLPDNRFAQILADEAAAPRFRGELNGIRIAPGAVQSGSPCESYLPVAVAASEAIGTSLEVSPRLEPGTLVDFEEASSCGGEIAVIARGFTFPIGAEGSKFGGDVTIVRSVGAPESGDYLPASRVEVDTIAGRPAVVVPPPTSDGFGPSAVLIREPWGLTTLRASGLTASHLRLIAESLYEGAATR